MLGRRASPVGGAHLRYVGRVFISLPMRWSPSIRPTWVLPALLAWLAAAPGAQAVELPEPVLQAEAVIAPDFKEDPARPPDAPTAAAIASVMAEDGPAAGTTLAAKALSISRAAYGPDDPRLFTPLLNLGIARQRSADTAGALHNYQAAIESVQAASGPRDPRLFDAWYAMGHARLQMGQYGPAVEALGTALQSHRINQGLYSAAQLDVLHSLAVALQALGRNEDANEIQHRRMAVAERVYAQDAPALAHIHALGGRWFLDAGRTGESMRLYTRALRLIEETDEEDPRLIEPLLGLALVGSVHRRDPDEMPIAGVPQPGSALARAERLAENRRGGSAAQRAAELTRVGDAYHLLGRRDAAMRLYVGAADLLAAEGIASPFGQPAFLRLQVPQPAPVDGGGEVLAEFGVETNGRTRDVRIVEARPATLPPTVAASLSRALRQARLRPRIVNGEAVDSSGVRYRLPVRGGSVP